MKKETLLFFMLLGGLSFANAQPRFVNGTYENGFHIAQVDKTHIRGYFESYTGMDETTGQPLFSCVFMLEGTFDGGDKYTIKTYYPFDADTIRGKLMVADTNMIHIWLDEDPGGCWNVQSFASGWQTFMLDKKTPVINYSYIKSDKAYFHQSPDPKTVRKGYILKSQFVQVERIQNNFAYCRYEGEKVTKGWIKLGDLGR
ncbi:hypothetical protein [Fluviicola sp.]|uniref:hypothetical protein n=1 Tax=Fluviicola sp. TaxID=1917219 RepID=UPI0031CE850F